MKSLMIFASCSLITLSFPTEFICGQPREEDPEPGVATTKAIQEQLAKAAEREALFAKEHPLGMDPKLHPRFTVIAQKPPLAELLQQLAEATGLAFSLADNLTYHDPNLGHLKVEDVAAYSTWS